ncbi:amidase [Diaphorobacter sp. HDW4A]|uniref:amidase n=1 Tax=Diaphorobacter sp. HDW4A TaxID=2714924 RepID=UPI0014079364|nr:amidase [Diaphorobacter sp. HDW4A]QIL79103.1 amidase [Diaphorobacter sp. HDW4A]
MTNDSTQPGKPPATGGIVELAATELSRAIHAREVSCVEVLDAYFAQIDRFNPQVNAIVASLPREQLRTQASALDADLARGESRGVLHGFPQAPKDIMPAKGMVTTKGSPIFKGQVSQTDAVVFDRMRASGAIFVGRTNSPEFGLGGHTYNEVYGTTRNAFDPSLSAGGSSGGAGVCVALRMLPVADGSDMMGSLRTPAAFNHVYGMRTSVGCIPHGPTDEIFFQQFSVGGPMARNVPDLALLLSVMGGFDARLPLTHRAANIDFRAPLVRDFKGARIAWLGDLGGHLPTEPGLLEVCDKALVHFEAIGCIVDRVLPQFDMESLWRAWLDLRSFQFAGTNRALYDDPAKRRLLKPEAVWELERGLALTAMQVFDAARVRSAWYECLRRLHLQYEALLLPSAQVFPFDAALDWPHAVGGQSMDTYHRWMQTVIGATMAGLPALSVPAGLDADGRPVGLQIIGRTQDDFGVLQLGHAYDLASGASKVRSPLLG